MPFAQILLLVVYYAMLGLVACVMIYRALLVLRYYLRERGDEVPQALFDEPPVVTVQLPVFNERYVVRRIHDLENHDAWLITRTQVLN